MSNRLTFSLASLILMFAFVAMPAMAHDADSDASPPIPEGHVHVDAPVVTSIELVDLIDGTATVRDSSVTLIQDPNADPVLPIDLTAASGTSTGRFQVKVTFSEPVYKALTSTADSPGALAATDLMITAASQAMDGTNLIGNGINVAAPARMADDATTEDVNENLNTFILTFAVERAIIGDSDATDAELIANPTLASDLPVDVWITVNADVLTTLDGSLIDGVSYYGTGNAASARMKFTIVAMLDDPENMVTITTIPAMPAVGDTFTAVLTFTEAVTALTAANVVVTGGTAADPVQLAPTVWTSIITPADDATSISVSVADTVAMGDTFTIEPEEVEMADMLEAGDYLVVVRDASMVTSGYFGANGPSMADVHVWAGMPNLERLFSVGGKLELTVTGATTRQVVISEVMWAVDNRLIGDDAYDDGQWIEIHNRTSGDNAKDFALSGITLNAAEGRFPTPTTTDWLMNTPSGDRWTVPGQSGNSGDAEGAGKVNFVSVWRNNYGEPGHQSNRWAASSELYKPNHKGTPGMKERPNFGGVTPTPANRGPVIFNEISNNDNPAYEWIELRNVTDGEVNLKNWEITIVTSKGADQANHNAVEFIQFPNADRKMAAGSLLLVVATDPRSDDDHPLQTGWDITKGAGDQINGVNQETSPRYIVLPFKTAKEKGTTTDLNESGMPDDGEFVLILRNRGDRTSSNSDNNVRDVAGYVPGRALATNDDATGLWPLANFPQPNWDNNKLAAGIVQKRAFADIDGTKSKGNNENDKTAFRDDNNRWTGIGYRRNAAANNQNGGTPGYPNGALQSNETEAGAEPVIISEVMYATGSRANIPQWIELYNTSKTVGVNLDGWRVTIINHDQDVGGETYAGDLNKDYAINGKIPPGQTFLLVAYPGRDDTNLPDERIETLRGNRGELILSQYGFEITLLTKGKDNKDANRKLADRVGNLATVAEGAGRVRRNPQSYEDPAWMLPMGTNDDGDRISIVRASIMGDPINGQLSGAWNRFDMSGQFVSTLDATSYGHGTDLSSPGHTVGGVLPVSLSKFRPERLKDTGEIVIRWITESELNNAGFNILRSETRDGEFTKINTKLIAGQGTTSERTTYEYADTSAKPNVVYYYQIQDVSLDGQVQTLRQSRLKGNVTAAGKLTTTWGELKALQ